jgi:hypothetical protein
MHKKPVTKPTEPRQNLREPGVSSASGEQQPDCLIVYVCVCHIVHFLFLSVDGFFFCFCFVSSFAAGGIE